MVLCVKNSNSVQFSEEFSPVLDFAASRCALGAALCLNRCIFRWCHSTTAAVLFKSFGLACWVMFLVQTNSSSPSVSAGQSCGPAGSFSALPSLFTPRCASHGLNPALPAAAVTRAPRQVLWHTGSRSSVPVSGLWGWFVCANSQCKGGRCHGMLVAQLWESPFCLLPLLRSLDSSL